MTSFLFWNIFIKLFIEPLSCFIPFKWKKEKPIRGRYSSLLLQPIPDAAADRAERNTGADFTAHHTDMIFQFGYGSGFQCTILRLLLQHTILSEPEFVNLLRSQGFDSQPGGPVRLPYLTYRPAKLQRLAGSIPWNRFPGSFNEYKYRAGIFKPLWSPGIDAKASTPPAYVAWRAGTITLFLVGA